MNRKNVNIEIKKQYAIEAVKWCKDNLGINKRKKNKLKISVRVNFKKTDEKNFNGSYYSNENRIVIYDLNCVSLEDVVSTVIHEYTHYLQSMKKYWEYFKTHYYSTHPYERQARRNEEKYTELCLKSIKKSI
jgi:Zn-dependent peptidase ImmA (M78 family)